MDPPCLPPIPPAHDFRASTYTFYYICQLFILCNCCHLTQCMHCIYKCFALVRVNIVKLTFCTSNEMPLATSHFNLVKFFTIHFADCLPISTCFVAANHHQIKFIPWFAFVFTQHFIEELKKIELPSLCSLSLHPL